MSYIVGHPVKHPANFYGREEQISQFFEIIGGEQAQSISILGLRRSGKTSFLLHVSHPVVMVRYLPRPEKVVMAYVDMKSCKKPAHFYYRVLSRLKFVLGDVRTGFNWTDSPPDETSIHDVEAYLRQFPTRRIILLLDDFDQMPVSLGETFLNELRAMTSVADYDLAFVTASYYDFLCLDSQSDRPFSIPFYHIFYPGPIYIGRLSSVDMVEALICTPALQAGHLVEADDIAQIKKLAGSFPFFLQATAARWFYFKRLGHLPDYQTIMDQMAAELSVYFTQWWSGFDACQRQILWLLAQHRSLAQLPYDPLLIKQAKYQLQQYGLLVERRRRLHINGAIFHRWIRQMEMPCSQENASGLRKDRVNPIVLREVLSNQFNLDELHTLCFDLGMDYENLPGQTKSAKARDLVDYWHNRQDLTRLIEAVRNERGMVV